MSHIYDIISVSVIAAYVIPFLLYIHTGAILYVFLTVWVGISTAISLPLKILSRKLFGDITHRPKGASYCDTFNLKPKPSEPSGFPSGHMITVTTFCVAMCLVYPYPVVVTSSVIWITLMGIARYKKKCHDVPQVIGGIAFGAIFGTVFVFILLKLGISQ